MSLSTLTFLVRININLPLGSNKLEQTNLQYYKCKGCANKNDNGPQFVVKILEKNVTTEVKKRKYNF